MKKIFLLLLVTTMIVFCSCSGGPGDDAKQNKSDPSLSLTVQTTEGKTELACYSEGKLLLHLQAPEFEAGQAGTNFPVLLKNTPPQVKADQTSWVQEISIEYFNKTYGANYELTFSPIKEGSRKRLKVKCDLKPQSPLPFDLSVRQKAVIEGLSQAEAVLPRRDGKVAYYDVPQKKPLMAFQYYDVPQQKPLQAYWFLGSGFTREGLELALPLIGLRKKDGGSDILSVATDPYLGVQFNVLGTGDSLGTVSVDFVSSFQGSLSPVQTETRTIEISISSDSKDELFKTFYHTIPDIKPGPAWIHDIQLNYYDYIADEGRSLKPDLEELTKRIPEKYRKNVLVCLHGYYDYLGRYAYNNKTKRIDDAWKAYDEKAQMVPMTKEELHRRIKMVKEMGFRCAIYYFDAMAYEDANPEFNPEWIWRDETGNPIIWYYWQKRPDSKGHTNYMMNPAHPGVRQWFLDYTKALITEFGKDLDCLVWDETNAVQQGTTAKIGSGMTEADRAMMRLVSDITREVQRGWTLNPDLAFMTSDCIDAHGPSKEVQVPYCLVSHGTYQDSWCDPKAWSPGMLPNYRNCLISCNWSAVKNRDWNRIAAEEYGMPQGLANGFGEDIGPSEMPKEILDEVIARFIKQVEKSGTH